MLPENLMRIVAENSARDHAQRNRDELNHDRFGCCGRTDGQFLLDCLTLNADGTVLDRRTMIRCRYVR